MIFSNDVDIFGIVFLPFVIEVILLVWIIMGITFVFKMVPSKGDDDDKSPKVMPVRRRIRRFRRRRDG